jgi:Fe-S-cluster containining protein
MNFLRWDYNTKEVTRFRRMGQCKSCGACCRKRIHFRVSSDNGKEYRDGGETTDDTGVWYEVESATPRRFFGHFKITEGDTCIALETNPCFCDSYEDRHNLCRDWPLGPKLALPNCGYSFEEVERWSLDELA